MRCFRGQIDPQVWVWGPRAGEVEALHGKDYTWTCWPNRSAMCEEDGYPGDVVKGTGVMKPWATQRNPDFYPEYSGKSSYQAGLRPDLIWHKVRHPWRRGRRIQRWKTCWAEAQRCSIQDQDILFYLPAAILEWMVCIYIFWSISFGLFKRPIFPLALNFKHLLCICHIYIVISWEIYFVRWVEKERRREGTI